MMLSPHHDDEEEQGEEEEEGRGGEQGEYGHDSKYSMYSSTVRYERQDFFVLGEEEEQPQSETNTAQPADESFSIWSYAQKIRSDQPGDVPVPFVYTSRRADDQALDSSEHDDQAVGEQREPDGAEMESASEDSSAILVEQTLRKLIY